MYIIVIGCGKVGSKFATVLSQEGHDVVIVDDDHGHFDLLDDDFSGIRIEGVPIDQDVLKQAGIERADALAAMTPDDNINIMVGQIAKEIYKVPKVVSRIFNPSREKVFQQFGLETICPTSITVDVIHSMIRNQQIIAKHTIGAATATFMHEVPKKHQIGKKVKDVMMNDDIHIFGILRNEILVQAKLNMIIEKEDILVLSRIID